MDEYIIRQNIEFQSRHLFMKIVLGLYVPHMYMVLKLIQINQENTICNIRN